MKTHGSATDSGAETLLDVAALRADTPGCEQVVHFNNAGCGLLAAPVLATMLDHLNLEARIGGYEAAAARAEQVRDFYTETAALINCAPGNIAFAGSATHAYATALSSIPFEAGDVILTTRNDFISNQIAFLSLRKRFGVRLVHAPDLPEGGVDVAAMAALMRAHRPRLVAATHIPTNSGLVQPIAEIGAALPRTRTCSTWSTPASRSGSSRSTSPRSAATCSPPPAASSCAARAARASCTCPTGSCATGTSPCSSTCTAPAGSRRTATGRWRRRPGSRSGSSRTPPCWAARRPSATPARSAWTAIARRTPALAARLRARLGDLAGVRLLDRGRTLGALVTFEVEGWQAEPFKAAMDARGDQLGAQFPGVRPVRLRGQGRRLVPAPVTALLQHRGRGGPGGGHRGRAAYVPLSKANTRGRRSPSGVRQPTRRRLSTAAMGTAAARPLSSTAASAPRMAG